MNSIEVKDLRKKIADGEDIVLVDVREPWERELFNIGGISVPMNSVFEDLSFIPTDKPVIFYCEKGIRSMIVIQRLVDKFGYTNLFNLSGGMSVWKMHEGIV